MTDNLQRKPLPGVVERTSISIPQKSGLESTHRSAPTYIPIFFLHRTHPSNLLLSHQHETPLFFKDRNTDKKKQSHFAVIRESRKAGIPAHLNQDLSTNLISDGMVHGLPGHTYLRKDLLYEPTEMGPSTLSYIRSSCF